MRLTFDEFVDKTQSYNAAIREAGDLPWFENPEKLAKLESHIPGITAMEPLDRRRALFDRHRREAA